jgi:aerobic carbon-monoxide dehydrogenase medium subunit
VKAASFGLKIPHSIEEAIGFLEAADGEGKVLAGGQSLVPLMAFRLARPEVLVDLNGLDELAYIREDGPALRIGAMTRQRALEQSALISRRAPLIAEALPSIAHAPIRNRGTIGGSIAHADPSAELPMLCLTLDAEFTIRGVGGGRTIAAADFFIGPFMTQLGPDEILTEIRLPDLPAGTGTAFRELARRRGDFATVAVAAALGVDQAGRISEARLGYASMGTVPIRARAAEQWLAGQPATPAVFAEAAAMAGRELRPGTDLHTSAGFRSHLAEVVTRRTLATALARSPGQAS